jgi:hypothetical protein
MRAFRRRLTVRMMFLAVAMVISGSAHAYSEQYFTVTRVGASNNTNTVFIDVSEIANNTTCGRKDHFKLPLTDQLADKFFSAALTAQAQGRRLVIGYEADECIHGGILPRVFKVAD